MRLTNFEIAQSVALTGLGGVWDLHNCAEFGGMELIPEERAVRLHWMVSPESSWANPARWCAIRFDGVSAVWVTRTRTATDPGNARTLVNVELVAPKERTPADAIKLGVRVPSSEADSQMLFEFMDGYDIEIAASGAVLEAENGDPNSAGPPPMS